MTTPRSEGSNTTRPENQLLLHAARVAMDAPTAECVRTLLQRGLDWPCLLRAAEAHSIAPLLYWHLNQLAPSAVPVTVLTSLRQRFLENARNNLLLTGELLRLLRLFAAHGIRVIPFKGPTLAACAYRNLALRQFVDLDLLVFAADFHRARDLLIADGYRTALSLRPVQEPAYLATIGQLPFVSPDRGCMVELHVHIAPRHFHFPLGAEHLWPRLRSLSLGGEEILTLDTEDLLLVLCVHGTKHLWSCLGWVCDLATLLHAEAGINWTRALAEARRARCQRLLLLGLLLAHELLQAPVPEEVVQRARRVPAVPALAARVNWQLFREGPVGAVRGVLFHFHAREHLLDGARYALSLVLAPTVADWAMLPLPTALSFLYYFVRPLRLLGKYARRALNLGLSGMGAAFMHVAVLPGAPRSPDSAYRERH